jgi:hypothetical protein
MFTPAELMFLAATLDTVRDAPGSVVEVGCAWGATTVWLSMYMDDQLIDRPYYAIDTFSGFSPEDIHFERFARHKSDEVYRFLQSAFTENSKAWFDKQMAAHDVTRVTSIECDVSDFDFRTVAPIAYCLLDVDLYLPIKSSLPRIRECMSPGGILIVDDCWNDEKWDGALQAYCEFTAQAHIPPRIVGRKLGIIQC